MTIHIQGEGAIPTAQHKRDCRDAIGNFHKGKYLLGYRLTELPGHTFIDSVPSERDAGLNRRSFSIGLAVHGSNGAKAKVAKYDIRHERMDKAVHGGTASRDLAFPVGWPMIREKGLVNGTVPFLPRRVH